MFFYEANYLECQSCLTKAKENTSLRWLQPKERSSLLITHRISFGVQLIWLTLLCKKANLALSILQVLTKIHKKLSDFVASSLTLHFLQVNLFQRSKYVTALQQNVWHQYSLTDNENGWPWDFPTKIIMRFWKTFHAY